MFKSLANFFFSIYCCLFQRLYVQHYTVYSASYSTSLYSVYTFPLIFQQLPLCCFILSLHYVFIFSHSYSLRKSAHRSDLRNHTCTAVVNFFLFLHGWLATSTMLQTESAVVTGRTSRNEICQCKFYCSWVCAVWLFHNEIESSGYFLSFISYCVREQHSLFSQRRVARHLVKLSFPSFCKRILSLIFMDPCIVVWLSRNNQQDATLY